MEDRAPSALVLRRASAGRRSAPGAGYIALLVLAYDRIGSAWGATAVLLADVLPAMLLGPLLGGLIDRTSRLGAAILADVIRAVAFAGLVFVDGTVAMVAFALLAGLGTALFRPGDLRAAAGPGGRASGWRRPTALFNAVRETGFLLGPVLAAGAAGGRPRRRPCSASTRSPSRSPRCCCARLRGHVRDAARPARAMTAPRPACARCSRQRGVVRC